MIVQADARHIPLRDESVQCVITSPPYWGLRDYGIEPSMWGAWLGCLGLEPTPELFVQHIVEVFHEVRRVLRDDGTCWINLGDSYAGSFGAQSKREGEGWQAIDIERFGKEVSLTRNARAIGLKPKDLVGIPWRVAFALQADGWYLRQAIPWIKRNPMPESVEDRPSTAVEQVFLLSKSERYFYDNEAVKLPASEDSHRRYARGRSNSHKWADGGPGNQTIAKTFEHMRLGKEGPNSRMHVVHDPAHANRNWKGKRAAGVNPKCAPAGSGIKQNESFSAVVKDVVETRNRRNSDWFFDSWQGLLTDDDGWPLAFVVNTYPYKDAHFATFPPKLVKPMILAGAPVGGVVLDPFLGSGTTVQVAQDLGRIGIGLDLKPEYLQMARKRTAQQGLRL